MQRKAKAIWQGSIKKGKGALQSDSKTLDNTQYSFSSRFEQGTGTNPEELVAAAHAGCFAMQLSAFIGEEGFNPEKLEADCTITLEDGKITNSHIKLEANVPEISKEKFDELAKNAEKNCPISKLLDTEITLEYNLSN